MRGRKGQFLISFILLGSLVVFLSMLFYFANHFISAVTLPQFGPPIEGSVSDSTSGSFSWFFSSISILSIILIGLLYYYRKISK